MQAATDKSGRNNAVDLLRFVFCMGIVCHHSYMLMNPAAIPCYFQGAWILTDFFFFLSGIFMIESANWMPLDYPVMFSVYVLAALGIGIMVDKLIALAGRKRTNDIRIER